MLYLDSPVTYEDITFFRDFSDPKLYYYLPKDVLIGKDEKSLHFALDTKQVRGFLALESVLGFIDKNGENSENAENDISIFDKAVNQLKQAFGNDIRITPVPFETGKVSLAMMGKSSDSKGENDKSDAMEIVIIGASKPCLTGNHQAAFNLKLENQAALDAYDLLSNTEQTQMTVFYEMDYLGVLPAYNLDITVDFEATEKYYNNKIDLDFDLEEKSKNLKVLVEADIDSIIQDMVNDGTIVITETDYTEGHRFNDGLSNQVELIKTLLGTELFNPTIFPPSSYTILKDAVDMAGGVKDSKGQGKPESGNSGNGNGSIPDKKNDAIPAENKKPSKSNPEASDSPTPEAPKGTNPKGDNPSDESPTNETPANETPANETPANETPANETPANETPANETPANETPANETPANETPANENLANENPAGKNPTDGDASTDGDNPDGKNPTDGDSNGGDTNVKKKSDLYISAKLGYTLKHRSLSEQVKRTFHFNRSEVKRLPFALSGNLSTSGDENIRNKQVHVINSEESENRVLKVTFLSNIDFAEYGINTALINWKLGGTKLGDSGELNKERTSFDRTVIWNNKQKQDQGQDQEQNQNPIINYNVIFGTKDNNRLETKNLKSEDPTIMIDVDLLKGNRFVKVRSGDLDLSSAVVVKLLPNGNENKSMRSCVLSTEKTCVPVVLGECIFYDAVIEYPLGSGRIQKVTYRNQIDNNFIVRQPRSVEICTLFGKATFANGIVGVDVKLTYNGGQEKHVFLMEDELTGTYNYNYEVNGVNTQDLIGVTYTVYRDDGSEESGDNRTYNGDTPRIRLMISPKNNVNKEKEEE